MRTATVNSEPNFRLSVFPATCPLRDGKIQDNHPTFWEKGKQGMMNYKNNIRLVWLSFILCSSPSPVSMAAMRSSAPSSTTAMMTSSHTEAVPTPGTAGTSIFAESALVDKETGRIFWEGGSKSTLSESLESKFANLFFAKGALVSLLLWGAFFGLFAARLRQKLQTLEWFQNLQTKAPILVALLQFTFLGSVVPSVPFWLLTVIVLVYLGEAFLCSTHQFLAHRSDCHNVETFIEELRQETPQVQWKLRVFHYEPLLQFLWQDLRQRFLSLTSKENSMFAVGKDLPATKSRDTVTATTSSPSKHICPISLLSYLVARKHIIKQVTGNFEWKTNGGGAASWRDATTAGVWTRARGETGPAPLAKILLNQVIVLGNRQAREEYFRRQGQFVKKHSVASELASAEFATHIGTPGFKPRVLVTRQDKWWCSRRVFWLCTLLGFSVLYRVWMARHCDVIRVSLVKETRATQPRSWWSGHTNGSTGGSKTQSKDDAISRSQNHAAAAFRNLMQQLEVYRPHPAVPLDAQVMDEYGAASAVPTAAATTASSVQIATTGTITNTKEKMSENLALGAHVLKTFHNSSSTTTPVETSRVNGNPETTGATAMTEKNSTATKEEKPAGLFLEQEGTSSPQTPDSRVQPYPEI